MKNIILSAIIALMTLNTSAQKLGVNAGPELGMAIGDFFIKHSGGIGVTIQPELKIASQFNLVAISGLKSYSGKSATSETKYKAQIIVPLQIGVKYFFTNNISNSYYAGTDFGTAIFVRFSEANVFAYSIGFGKKFTAKKQNMDIALRYDGYSMNGSLSALNLRMGFNL